MSGRDNQAPARRLGPRRIAAASSGRARRRSTYTISTAAVLLIILAAAAALRFTSSGSASSSNRDAASEQGDDARGPSLPPPAEPAPQQPASDSNEQVEQKPDATEPVISPVLPDAATTLSVTVTKVIDGDTIIVDGKTKVRYVGMDTPEYNRPGFQQSVAANRRLVEGREVQLELDVQQRDRYQRLLAYVWVGEVLVNLRLLQEGYAQVWTFPPNVRYERAFLEAQRRARRDKAGLWGENLSTLSGQYALPDAGTSETTVFVTREGDSYHLAGCPSLPPDATELSLSGALARRCSPCQTCCPSRR